MPNLYRSLIFVPGNNPRFLSKVPELKADIVCLDLEDSVPAGQKREARRLVLDLLRGSRPDQTFVRVNAPSSDEYVEDLRYIMPQTPPDGIVIPKVDDAQAAERVLATVKDLEPAGSATQILPSIESAAGVVNSYRIARCSRVCAIMFGIFDLLNDMQIEYRKDPMTAHYSRSKVPVDAAAAGVAAIDGIWQDTADAAGFEADCRLGRSLGYSGKSLIHPGQVDAAHRLFAPTQPEIQWARRVCAAYQDTVAAGRGATRVDGKMIDEVHYKRALAVLDAAE